MLSTSGSMAFFKRTNRKVNVLMAASATAERRLFTCVVKTVVSGQPESSLFPSEQVDIKHVEG